MRIMYAILAYKECRLPCGRTAMAVTVRLQPETHKALKETASLTGESIQEALDKAVQERRRRLYLEGLSADYAALRADPKASADLDKESALWERTSNDALEDA
jgi:hypothetical protein